MARATSIPFQPNTLSSVISQSLSLVSSITSLLQTLNPQNPNLPNPSSSPLNCFSPHLSPNLVIHVIKAQKNPFHGLFFFNWASNPNPNPNLYSHTHLCYVAITDLLLSHGLVYPALSLLKSSNKLSDFMMGKFIKYCGDRNDIKGAIHWLNQAKTIESGRCLFSYNAILGVLVRANRIRLARDLFSQIVEEGVARPDVFTYTTMIKGFCKNGMIGDAKKVFDEMPCKPNLVTYNTIVNGFCKKGLMDNARILVDCMIDKECLPDAVTYTTLIDGYCKISELEEAKRCMEQMVSRDCEPNVLTYNAMINGLCLSGRVDEAKLMMTKMRLNGLRDDISTHTSILKGLCIVGKSDEAIKHLQEMGRLGMKLDVKSYGVVLNEYCKIRKPNGAIALLREMKAKGINPSVSSFNAILRALVECGELARAVHFLKQMERMGCSPNFLSYSTVICSLCNTKGWMNKAGELVTDMLRNGHIMGPAMCSCLVRGYCKEGNEEMAMRSFCKMIDMGYVIDLESFDYFVKELCARGKAYEVENVFKIMLSMKSAASDIDCYRRVLNEHIQERRAVDER